jgi:WD40 repeat protein
MLTVLLVGTFIGAASASDELATPAGVVATLKGHTEMVYAIAFSPDGRHVLTGSFDNTLRLWEAATGKEVKSFGGPSGHQNHILTVAFSPDGRLLASGGMDNTVRLWDSPIGGPLREYVHTAPVNALAVSPDGTRLAGACKDGTIKVWNTADGKQLLSLAGHTGPVTGLAFAGNGQLLASSGSDRMVRFWNVANGQPAGALGTHAAAVNAMVMVGNNLACTASDDGLLKLWRVPVPAPRNLAAHTDVVTALTISPDGRTVVTGSADKTLRLSNFDNGQPLKQFQGPTAAISAVALASNNATVAAGTAHGKLYLWNTADNKLLSDGVAHSGAVTAVAFHPQNNQLLTADGQGLLKLWTIAVVKKPGQQDRTEVKPAKMFEAHTGGVAAVAFHSNGSQVLSGGADRLVKLWDLTTGKVVRTYGPMGGPVTAVAFSRDFVQVGAAGGKTAVVWNAADGKEVLSVAHPADVTALSFNADKTWIATGAADNEVRVWDVATGKELEFFPQAGPIRAVAFHNNNTAVVSVGMGKAAVVHTLSIVRVMTASPAPIRDLTLTPNGSHILTAGDDKTVKLWNLGNGANERTFVGAEAPVHAVAVSRNGVLLAAGGADRTVRVYTFGDAKQQGVFKTGGVVRSLAFSPNSQTLAAACDDKSLVTWNVLFQPGQPALPEFGKPGQSFAQADVATGVTFLLDGTGLYSAGLDKTIKGWKLAADTPIKNLGHANLVDTLAFNPDGTQIVTGSHDGTVRIWDVAKGQQLRQINAHTPANQNFVYCVTWSPNGKQVVSGSFDHSLKLWDAASGALVREFKGYKEKESPKGHREGVYCAAFSPDGKFLASGSGDRGIKIWDVTSGAVVRELVNPGAKAAGWSGAEGPQAHPGSVYSLRFTPDGSRLVSVGNAPHFHGYLAVWNVADGRLIYSEEFALGPFNAVAVSPDGKFLALACGTRGTQYAGADCYVLKMPEADKRQASQAGK